VNKHSPPELEEYYREAATWNHDRVRAARSSQRTAWYVAGAAVTVAILEAIALAVLTPLKTVEPYTLMVDRTTGYVQAVKPLDPATIAPDKALTQSFLVQYVTSRESFDFATLQPDYRKVALMSGESARSSYLAAMQASNPASPINTFPRGTVVQTRIKSVSPVGKDTAFVRFDTVRTEHNGQSHVPAPWVATIRYQYSGEPMKLEDRFVNPLGFRVLSYRRDPEAPPPAPVPLAAPAPAHATVSTTVQLSQPDASPSVQQQRTYHQGSAR
jgi:type IV secretion system protein VirB8